jgi:hypothetical protein
MKQRLVQSLTRLAPAGCGWMLLLAGMVLLGSGLLVQTWSQCRELDWYHRLMLIQERQLTRQEEQYRGFHDALASADPVLIERLAYQVLHLKPVGVAIIPTPAPSPFAYPSRWSATTTDAKARLPQRADSIEDWLYVPVPQLRVDYPPPQPVRSTLVRMSTGTKRLGVILVGAICIALGLLSAGAPGSQPHPNQESSTRPDSDRTPSSLATDQHTPSHPSTDSPALSNDTPVAA